jgi:hypothetical protein
MLVTSALLPLREGGGALVRGHRRPASPRAGLSPARSTIRRSDSSRPLAGPSAMPLGCCLRSWSEGARCPQFRCGPVSAPPWSQTPPRAPGLAVATGPCGLPGHRAVGPRFDRLRGSSPSPLRVTAWSSRCLRFTPVLPDGRARLASSWAATPSAAGIALAPPSFSGRTDSAEKVTGSGSRKPASEHGFSAVCVEGFSHRPEGLRRGKSRSQRSSRLRRLVRLGTDQTDMGPSASRRLDRRPARRSRGKRLPDSASKRMGGRLH